MEKIVGDWSTEVRMNKEEVESVCKLGKGLECCAFLAVSGEGCAWQKQFNPAIGGR